jgi:hypothetical protein
MTTTSSTPSPRTSTPVGRSSTQPAAAQADRLRALAGDQLARDRWSRDRLLAYQEERRR